MSSVVPRPTTSTRGFPSSSARFAAAIALAGLISVAPCAIAQAARGDECAVALCRIGTTGGEVVTRYVEPQIAHDIGGEIVLLGQPAFTIWHPPTSSRDTLSMHAGFRLDPSLRLIEPIALPVGDTLFAPLASDGPGRRLHVAYSSRSTLTTSRKDSIRYLYRVYGPHGWSPAELITAKPGAIWNRASASIASDGENITLAVPTAGEAKPAILIMRRRNGAWSESNTMPLAASYVRILPAGGTRMSLFVVGVPPNLPYRGPNASFLLSSADDGRTWSAPRPLGGPAEHGVRSVQIVLWKGHARVLRLVRSDDGASTLLRIATLTHAGRWSEDVALSLGDGAAAFSVIATQREVVVAYRGPHGSVRVARWTPGSWNCSALPTMAISILEPLLFLSGSRVLSLLTDEITVPGKGQVPVSTLYSLRFRSPEWVRCAGPREVRSPHRRKE